MNLRRVNLAVRLFAAQVLVLAVGGLTLALVAGAVGPRIFHEHLGRVGGEVSAEARWHVEQAYASANALALGVGLLAALAAALAASVYATRRIASPVTHFAHASASLADGHYDVRMADPRLGDELETLTDSFNTMAERLETVEATRRRLLADLGHELRTPLATIEAYLEAAEDGVAVDDEDLQSVLRAQTARLHRLADDIAAVSRAETHQLDLHPVRTAPADLVRDALAAARPRYAGKGVTLRSDVRPAAHVDVDPQRMGQVLGNLLDNALRHTPEGGTVTVRVTGGARNVELAVVDTGPGIPAEHLPHVFERFYRVDTARDRDNGGSGIGLAIVRAVVSAHGGRVRAENVPGGGAMFKVMLPPVGQAQV
ncbi:HAMP domain-containing sensor histidine kinase [Verrucosispora sp. WMMD703]|uniref:HAMP domain-containing sensor histidine kinase n=1 Tax=Verrucosispora sp. WMMD703 TaxID=3403463 RepID=UPI003B936CEB